MKPTLLTFAVVFCLGNLSAQTETPHRSMFKMSPQHLVQNTLKAGIEVFHRSKPSSFLLLLNATSNNGSKNPYPLFPYKGFGLELAHRKYIAPIQEMTNRKGKTFTQGIYFSVFLQGGAYKGDYDFIEYDYDFDTQTHTEQRVKYSQSAQQIATGFTIGLQRVYWKILAVDFYVGTGYQVAIDEIEGELPTFPYQNSNSSVDNAAYAGVIPKGGIILGLFLQ